MLANAVMHEHRTLNKALGMFFFYIYSFFVPFFVYVRALDATIFFWLFGFYFVIVAFFIVQFSTSQIVHANHCVKFTSIEMIYTCTTSMD